MFPIPGISATASGYLVDWYSRGSPDLDYLPAMVFVVGFLAADALLISRISMNIPSTKVRVRSHFR